MLTGVPAGLVRTAGQVKVTKRSSEVSPAIMLNPVSKTQVSAGFETLYALDLSSIMTVTGFGLITNVDLLNPLCVALS
ncbi:hypothetical protein SDC9_175430 [bioreactor metagenome]|uniref:Uncharacterized protein n=1 Tax=bioreactor metagenome TaxID=1076179 RepID=A0A645GP85_9ZZZZ